MEQGLEGIMQHSVIFSFICLFTHAFVLCFDLQKSHLIANSTHLIETSTSLQCLICGQNTLYNIGTTAQPVIKRITLPILLCFLYVGPNYSYTSVALMDVWRAVFFETYSTYETKKQIFFFFTLNNLSGSFNPLISISLESI